MKKTNKYISLPVAIVLMAVCFVSCKKFLDEPPSKSSSLVVTTTEQLNALLNNYSIFEIEANLTATCSHDDYALPKALYDARPATFSMTTIQYMLWDISYIPDDYGSKSFWSDEYRKIFYANTVLESVDKVTGPDSEKDIIRADAHLIRAYSYYELVNTYCLPYTDATKNEPGLPIKRATSFEEPSERQPLSKVYELIEADLAEALKTPVPLVQNGKARHWRASKAGVNGFAARYYLSRNNYAKALAHANAALGEYSTLVDYNTEMRYGTDQTVTINSGTPLQQTVTIKYPFTSQVDYTDILGWKEFIYFRGLRNQTSWFIPSPDLRNLYDSTNDLRFRYHIVEDYSYDRGMTQPSYSYPGYIFFFRNQIPSGPTVAEMLLIKAEALARTNIIAEAMTTVNLLRAKRMLPGAWVNLTASSKNEAIQKILQERRREMPFVQRWFDIRRLNNNEDPSDDVELTKSFYPYTNTMVDMTQPLKTYTLPKNSRRWAAPIPRADINASNGAILQNSY